MNIFVLHKNIQKCAQMHCDKHVVKMILESTMMLYTACWFVWYEYESSTENGICSDLAVRQTKSKLKIKDVAPRGATPSWLEGAPLSGCGNHGYRPTHYNHPCSIWVRESLANYYWLCDLALALCEEYKYRYDPSGSKGKKHACEKHIAWLISHSPPIPDMMGLTEFRQAMPDEYKILGDPILAYRRYYCGDKVDFAVWTGRPEPDWFVPKSKNILKKSLTFKKKSLTFKKKGLTFKKKGLTFKKTEGDI